MIRAYRTEDLPVVMDIANRAWRQIRKISREALGDRISDLLRPLGDEFSKGEEIRRQALADPEHFWVCEEDSKVVGFITFAIDEQHQGGEILNNAADPDCGIKGIGQQMYKAVLEYFRQKGLKFVKVTTGLDEGHAGARKAYERAGFDRSLQYVTYYQEL
jgi:ribosomal protein S18 acetylase RimI-like enzyme